MLLGSKKTRWTLAGLGVVVLLALILWYSRPQTPRTVAIAVLHAYESGRASALWPYIPPEEKRAYGLTPEKLRTLMDDSGFGSAAVPQGQIMIQEDESAGSAVASRWYRIPGVSHPCLFATYAEYRGPGVIGAKDALTTLLYAGFYIAGSRQGDVPKPLALLRGATLEFRTLERAGISGVWSDSSNSLVPWPELIEQLASRYERYKSDASRR